MEYVLEQCIDENGEIMIHLFDKEKIDKASSSEECEEATIAVGFFENNFDNFGYVGKRRYIKLDKFKTAIEKRLGTIIDWNNLESLTIESSKRLVSYV